MTDRELLVTYFNPETDNSYFTLQKNCTKNLNFFRKFIL